MNICVGISALVIHGLLLTLCCVVVRFICTERSCCWIFRNKDISSKQGDITAMDLEEEPIELFCHLLVHVEGCARVAVVKVASKLSEDRVCRSGQEHRLGDIWKWCKDEEPLNPLNFNSKSTCLTTACYSHCTMKSVSQCTKLKKH